jgi:ppGpp synthetase/RelA/SpoT-type nucleotidyltranferase
MKVPTSIRNVYNDLKEKYTLLEERVENTLSNLKDKNWHYVGRVKKLESFALKVETGRYPQPESIDDFFACTLVVENLSSVAAAEELITKTFELYERRPNTANFTNNHSDSFKFEDLRLYVKWKDSEGARPSGLQGLTFEVQIKTFLQHAWSIATHSLIYKSDEKNWSKERIAFQIKAMLEHAETSIQEAEGLSKSKSLNKSDKETLKISKIIVMLNDLWSDTSLPSDKKRLAENIYHLIRNVGINLDSLKSILDKETKLGRGTKTLNLSPYAIIIQSLFNQEQKEFLEYLNGPENNFKIYLHEELEIPPDIDTSTFINGIAQK